MSVSLKKAKILLMYGKSKTMTEPEKKRKWWQRKTELGVLLMITGAIMHFIPITAPIASTVTKAGEILTGVGVIHRNLKGQAK